MEKLLLPKLGQTMEEGVILDWLVTEGDSFAIDDELYEVETEKSTVTVLATVAGVLRRVVVPAGEPVKVGTTVAVAQVAGENPSDADVDEFLGGLSSGDTAEAAAEAVPTAVGVADLADDLIAVGKRTVLEGVRKATARVVSESWQEIPQFQQVTLADATRLLADRAAAQAAAGGDGCDGPRRGPAHRV